MAKEVQNKNVKSAKNYLGERLESFGSLFLQLKCFAQFAILFIKKPIKKIKPLLKKLATLLITWAGLIIAKPHLPNEYFELLETATTFVSLFM